MAHISNSCDLSAMAGEHHTVTLEAHKCSRKQLFWKILEAQESMQLSLFLVNLWASFGSLHLY